MSHTSYSVCGMTVIRRASSSKRSMTEMIVFELDKTCRGPSSVSHPVGWYGA